MNVWEYVSSVGVPWLAVVKWSGGRRVRASVCFYQPQLVVKARKRSLPCLGRLRLT